MKAAVVREFGQPLAIEGRPVPEPGPGQIAARMGASGLCHTDIHAANGGWPVKPTPPFVPGHEGVRTVHAVGAGVTRPAACRGLRHGGRLVLVALPAAGTLSIPVFDTVLNGTSVIGLIVGTRADLADVFALHAAGRTRVIYETRPLGSANTAVQDVLQGKARARLVLAP